jgi:hypothetical protein
MSKATSATMALAIRSARQPAQLIWAICCVDPRGNIDDDHTQALKLFGECDIAITA